MKSFPLFILFIIFIVLAGCQSDHTEKENASSAADIVSTSGLTGDSVKLIKTASIHVKVKDVHRSARAVSEVARQSGGMVSHHNIEAAGEQTRELKISDDSIMVISTYSTRADITARIPAESLEDFMHHITELGYFTTGNTLDIDDQSLHYLANQLKQQNRTPLLNAQSTTKPGTLTGRQLINTRDEHSDQEIAKRRIDSGVKYSTVQINLFQNPMVRKEIMANYALDNYRLSFSRSLSNALSDGWEYFLNFIIAVSHLWVFIVAALAVWLAFRFNYTKRPGGMSGRKA